MRLVPNEDINMDIKTVLKWKKQNFKHANENVINHTVNYGTSEINLDLKNNGLTVRVKFKGYLSTYDTFCILAKKKNMAILLNGHIALDHLQCFISNLTHDVTSYWDENQPINVLVLQRQLR